MTQSTFSPVKKGHIVPQVHQRSFAVNDQVAVHIDGRIDRVLMNIRDAATGWAAEAVPTWEVEVAVVPISDAMRARLLVVQAEQYR
ncbi:MAG: hypothetical protein QOD83_2547 [Solirubrobacteraceae bacterium]|jgi:hypothetical protein|nr:hypothetical protein [Solirubrobacteraceae bacterium]